MDILSPAVCPSQMNPESKQNGGGGGGGGKISPPVSCDDPQQQQHPQQQQQQQQRPTRYINNSTLTGSINKISNRSNSSTSKNKSLVRSHAVSEETSPPPPDGISANNVVSSSVNNNKNGKLRQQNSSSQQSSSLESSLSLENNIVCEKNGSEDNELLDFIIETLNKSPKDRSLIFRIENDLISFIKDPKRISFSFPQMSSYQRMLVHRVSGYFHLDHNLDNVTNSVVVTKNPSTRVPETRFRAYIEDHQQPGQESGKPVVLKRESAGTNKKDNGEQASGMNKARGKSLEERAEDYNRARRRIFNSEQQDSGNCCWGSSTESNTTNDMPGKPGRHYSRKSAAPNSNTLLKVESFETATINRKNKPPVVNKSYSFGGYGATDGNSAVIGNSNNMSLNRFSKQDSSSSSSGLSPASSGYKSQSFQSSTENTMTTPNSSASPQNNLAPHESGTTLTVEGLPPPSAVPGSHGNHPHPCVLTPVQPAPLSQQQYIFYPASTSSLVPSSGLMQGAPLQIQPHAAAPLHQPQQNPSQAENVVLWAVTDLNHVPPGSILIDPNSGQALKNTDGTMYHYDPINPPKHVIPQPHTSELVMYPSPQSHLQAHQQQHQHHQQQQQLVNTPGGDVEHVTQWFSQMGIPQPPPQQQQQQQVPSVPVNQQWGGEEYFVTSPHQPQHPPASSYIAAAAGAPPIIWDPSKIANGTIGLNQQYYPMQAPPQHPPQPPPSQQSHYVVAAHPPGAGQQSSQPVVMQYSVPTSSATAPYMTYMLQPYNHVAVAAAAAANYNSFVQYGQQPPQAPRQIHPSNVHQTPQQPIKLSKEFCYVPTSTTPTPATSTACFYNPFYGLAANAVAAAAHVQNQQPGGGHRFPGNPSIYQAQFIPRPSNSGYNNYRSNVKQPRKNRGRNFSSTTDRSSTLQNQQQHHHQQQQQQQQQQPPPPQQTPQPSAPPPQPLPQQQQQSSPEKTS